MNKYSLKKLSEICEIIAWQSPLWENYNQDWNWLPFYPWKKDFWEKYIWEPTVWTTQITKEALENDILMSVRAPVWPINFATQNICIGRGLAAIRSWQSIDKDYLFFSEGYDCCGDCKSEILILEEYILSQRDTYIKVEEDLLQIFGRVVDDKTLIERRLYSLEPIDFEEIKLRTSVINLGYYLSHLLGKRKLCECQPSNPNFRGKMGKVTHSKAAPNSIF